MLPDPVRCLLLFPVVTLGLAWPVAAKLKLEPAEKLCATAVLSLLGVYLLAFASYILGLPNSALWAVPLLALAGLLAGGRAFREMLGDPDARALGVGQLLVSAWCAGWLALVASYSGGGWAGDWFEHWERARFFLERWPREVKFLGRYLLPARPPLANLVTGAFLVPAGTTFASYQVIMTLLNGMAFLPAALLARRFYLSPGFSPGISPAGGRAVVAALAVLVMVNPSFVENATFAWTKLISAFFVLAGLYFFLRANDADAPAAALPLSAASLGGGILAHYSAGPYVLLLAAAWVALNFHRRGEAVFRRRTAQAAGIGAAVLATWFAWAIANYGIATTLASNTSATVQPEWRDHQFLKIMLNLRDTLVPHFLRNVDPALIEQRSAWGYLRDWFFQIYQVNLLFIFGSVAWLILPVILVREGRRSPARSLRFWSGFVGGAILLGVIVHGARDHWGLAHICLLAVVLLGLAYLAARWPGLGRKWKIALAAGAVVDLALGIALQFAVQSQALDRWLTPDDPPMEQIRSYTESTMINFGAKLVHHLEFFSDVRSVPGAAVAGFLAVILLLAVVRASRP
ncbi:MAG: hypothetical protein JWM88_2660 [Verrucomicrobia bacterium]|nr:hypothetical protein [Verrucomicrobiota bacterium]